MNLGSESDVIEFDAASGNTVFLSVDEFVAGCREISDTEKMRIMAIEARMISGTGRTTGELYAEALSRTVLGKRQCPTDVSIVAFLVMTMKSIASHDRERVKREKNVEYDDGNSEHLNLPFGALASDTNNPEAIIISLEEKTRPFLDVVHEHLDGFDLKKDTENLKMLAMGLSEGLRGKELRELLGVDQPGLDYLYKKLRRIMLAAYPNGYNR